jgi:hypothetical protein
LNSKILIDNKYLVEHSKHFTLTEARNKLKTLKPVLSKMIHSKKILDEINYDIYIHQYFGGIGTNGTGEHPEELDELIDCVRKISDEGVIIKDIGSGLIDFPHIRTNGEEVYLCYLFGEVDINYWHTLSGGFKGRRSLDKL